MRRLIVLCSAVVLIDTAFFAVLAPLLPSLTEEFSLSPAGAGILSGSYAAGVLVLALPGGWVAARFGPRRAVLLGLLGTGAFTPTFGFAEALWLLDFARFMQGASGALMWAGAMSWVLIAGPSERRGALVGILVAAATVGELIGAPVGALAFQLGMHVVFGAVGVLCAVLFVFALALPAPSQTSFQPVREALKRARTGLLWRALGLLSVAAIALGVVVVVVPLRLSELGGGPMLIAVAFALGSLIETILGPQVGRISDRVGRGGPYRLGAVLGAAALVVIGVVDVKLAVAGAMVLFAFGAGLAFAPSMAMAADAADRNGLDQGYASGLSNVAFGGGQMVGAVGAGALAAAGLAIPALVAAALFVVAALLSGR